MMKALRTFPLGSSSEPGGITAQHISDLLAGATVDSLQQAVIDFVNLILAAFETEVCSIIFGGRLHCVVM